MDGSERHRQCCVMISALSSPMQANCPVTTRKRIDAYRHRQTRSSAGVARTSTWSADRACRNMADQVPGFGSFLGGGAVVSTGSWRTSARVQGLVGGGLDGGGSAGISYTWLWHPMWW